MSRAIPTKPPTRPFQPAYTVTTTSRVPGRAGRPAEAEDGEVAGDAPEVSDTP